MRATLRDYVESTHATGARTRSEPDGTAAVCSTQRVQEATVNGRRVAQQGLWVVANEQPVTRWTNLRPAEASRVSTRVVVVVALPGPLPRTPNLLLRPYRPGSGLCMLVANQPTWDYCNRSRRHIGFAAEGCHMSFIQPGLCLVSRPSRRVSVPLHRSARGLSRASSACVVIRSLLWYRVTGRCRWAPRFSCKDVP